MGPFYCPQDRKVYLDLSFYEDMRKQLGASGDAAFAYVIAHEVGHHVQNLLGILPQVNQAQQGASAKQANALSVNSNCRPIALPAFGPTTLKRKICLKRAIWKKPSARPKPWAMTACKNARKAMPCPTASPTAHRPSAWLGFNAACKTATSTAATRLPRKTHIKRIL